MILIWKLKGRFVRKLYANKKGAPFGTPINALIISAPLSTEISNQFREDLAKLWELKPFYDDFIKGDSKSKGKNVQE